MVIRFTTVINFAKPSATSKLSNFYPTFEVQICNSLFLKLFISRTICANKVKEIPITKKKERKKITRRENEW